VSELDPLAGLRERHGMTLIVLSHDVNVAARADRVLHLVDGCIQDSRGTLLDWTPSTSRGAADGQVRPARVIRAI